MGDLAGQLLRLRTFSWSLVRISRVGRGRCLEVAFIIPAVQFVSYRPTKTRVREFRNRLLVRMGQISMLERTVAENFFLCRFVSLFFVG